MTESLLKEWARLQQHPESFPLKNLTTALLSDQTFLKHCPKSYITLALQHQIDLNFKISNVEHFPQDTFDRILNFVAPKVHAELPISKPKSEWTARDTRDARQFVTDTIANLNGEPCAFTDGSALGNPGPCGAAAIIYQDSSNSDTYTLLYKPIAQRSTSYNGELTGIELALNHFTITAHHPNVHLFCDCKSAMQSLETSSTKDSYQQTIDDIQQHIRCLKSNNCLVHIYWTPGHIEVPQNETADHFAKKAAMEAKALPSPTYVPTLNEVKGQIKTVLTNRWQRRWDRTNKDSLMYTCYPTVSTTRYKSATSIQAESRLVRILTGHNSLKEHLYRIKYAETPNCPCGHDRQTGEHLLLNCPTHNDIRLQMHLDIEHAYHKNTIPFQNRISSLANTLAPRHNDKTNRAIKKATGTFLTSLKLKI